VAHIRNKAGDVWQILLPDGSDWDASATAAAYQNGAGAPTQTQALPPQD
jgi:hypothetical protein